MRKVVLFANVDWYRYNFRLGLARELRNRGLEVVLATPLSKFAQLEHEPNAAEACVQLKGAVFWGTVCTQLRTVSLRGDRKMSSDAFIVVRPPFGNCVAKKVSFQLSIAPKK